MKGIHKEKIQNFFFKNKYKNTRWSKCLTNTYHTILHLYKENQQQKRVFVWYVVKQDRYMIMTYKYFGQLILFSTRSAHISKFPLIHKLCVIVKIYNYIKIHTNFFTKISRASRIRRSLRTPQSTAHFYCDDCGSQNWRAQSNCPRKGRLFFRIILLSTKSPGSQLMQSIHPQCVLELY